MQIRRGFFLHQTWSSETVHLTNFPKGRDQNMEPTHPHGQVENATASPAGGSPDPVGKTATFSCDLYPRWLSLRIKSINSLRVDARERKAPRMALVIITDPGFLIPRIVMQV